MRSFKRNVDMLNGPLIPSILSFVLPLMATSVLQLLYNAADIVVVGRYSGSHALAAVGASGSLIHLTITVFLGLSVGASVAVANAYGAQDNDRLEKTVHTSVTLSLMSSAVVTAFGLLMSRTLLEWMGTPEDVIDLAALYMRIYFCGIPANLLYNFGAAILRAVGDTRRPLVILSLSGIVNVLLNLFFVILCGMSVDGVALATIISQYLSAGAVMLCLLRAEDCTRLDIRKLRLNGASVREIARVGLPAGFQGAMFALSNVLIQSAVNGFGAAAVAGAAAAANIEGFVFVLVDSLHQAAITFASQNMGARRYSRIPKIVRGCFVLLAVVFVVAGGAVLLMNEPLLRIYNNDPEVIAFGARRQQIVVILYWLFGIVDILSGQLRGMGHSMEPTVVVLVLTCGLRIVWLYTVFDRWPLFDVVFYSYPVSWLVSAIALLVCYLIALRRLPKGDVELEQA